MDLDKLSREGYTIIQIKEFEEMKRIVDLYQRYQYQWNWEYSVDELQQQALKIQKSNDALRKENNRLRNVVPWYLRIFIKPNKLK